ncbi:MAG: hypothetical protein IJ530_00525 [Treponema sp.]|uniref:ribonuclease toxin HepT-like protein n=1 Tax=Treponema sp. TaxID=166 RepID=UPI0025F31595|nr:hypothetical protein [Treponema sp.]MBQ8678228.1 hypothetical protein [Treponema sp.]
MDNAAKTKINYEISQIDELIDKSQVLLSLVKNKEPDFVEITAIGGILHSFYNGIENIFVLIGKTLDFDFKSSPQWHRNLIDCMFEQPDFLPSDLRLLLTEYMGFRHFYRHTYGYTIKWEKCSHLFLGLPDFWNTVKTAISRYIENV